MATETTQDIRAQLEAIETKLTIWHLEIQKLSDRKTQLLHELHVSILDRGESQ